MLLTLSMLVLAADVPVCGAGVEPPCHDTVQEAIDAAVDGDRILIPLGLYEEAIRIEGRTLTLEGGRRGGIETRSDITGVGDLPPMVIVGGDVTLTGLALRPRDGRAMEVSGGATVLVDRTTMVAGSGVVIDGGLVHVSDADLELRRSSLIGGRAIRNGGVIYAEDGELRLVGEEDQSRVEGGTAGRAGGLIYADDLVVEGVALVDGRAQLGGAVAVAERGRARIEGEWPTSAEEELFLTRIVDCDATVGGAIHVADEGSLEAIRLHIYGSVGGALYLGNGAALDLTESRILHTEGPIVRGSGEARDLEAGGRSRIAESILCGATATTPVVDWGNLEVRHSFLVDIEVVKEGLVTNDVVLRHNHIVGTDAQRALVRFTGVFEYNLVAHNKLPFPQDAQAQARLRRNLWWANDNVDDVDGGSTDESPILGDPLLSNRTLVDCGGWPEMYPSWYGAARGALVVGGVYEGRGLPMPGAWGGIDEPILYSKNGTAGVADAWTITGDLDGDRVVNFYDCNHLDRDIYPGADDPPYDGIKSDCLPDDDYDVDGDGERSAEHHPEGTDCDDTDPLRGANQVEIDGNGKDDDCDGWADAQVGLQPSACSQAPGGAPVWLIGLALVVARRRSGRP